MHGLLSEYLLKGIYLGLLLFVALQKPSRSSTALTLLCTFGGLAICLGVAAVRKVREGYRIVGRLPAFFLFLLLESPGLVYSGVLIGTFVGAMLVKRPDSQNWFLGIVGAGGILGFLFFSLRHLKQRWARISLSFVLAGTLVGGALYWFQQNPDFFADSTVRMLFGLHLLAGIPVFYLLTFAGAAEESEVEIAAMCAALGLGLWMLGRDYFNQPAICLLIPMALYFVYTTRFLPNLRVFKHVIRGIGFANVGRSRQALLAFRRALQIEPQHTLAREHLWRLHRAMDLKKLDAATLSLVDYDLCLDRTTSLLLQGSPTSEQLSEATHLLNLIADQKPMMLPIVRYWQAVARTHERAYDAAAAELIQIVDPSVCAGPDPYRASILFAAWQLSLTLHSELNRRVGTPQLALPGRRIEAIAAVERRLADNVEDPDAWTLKRILYSGLTEDDYRGSLPPDSTLSFSFTALKEFDHGYAQQLGLALVSDSGRWQRGVEYLRIAARGLPAQGPTIFQQVAEAYERAGDTGAALESYEWAKRSGRLIGPPNLSEEERKVYFGIVKLLGEQARARGAVDIAIENYALYAEYERAGVETLRILADLHEQNGDVLAALRVNDRALVYNGKDKDLLERKDRYYYSVAPEQLRAQREALGAGFDVAYCLQKARTVLDLRDVDAEQLAWAEHLAELARIAAPDNVTAKVLHARALRRRGEIDAARDLLVEARDAKPSRFASSLEEESWYLSCRLLGELYLYDMARPDLAVACFNDYRQSSKSGADTLFKLGQAYEQIGDRTRAMKCFEHVTAYDSHPLAPEAREALYRLQAN